MINYEPKKKEIIRALTTRTRYYERQRVEAIIMLKALREAYNNEINKDKK